MKVLLGDATEMVWGGGCVLITVNYAQGLIEVCNPSCAIYNATQKEYANFYGLLIDLMAADPWSDSQVTRYFC